MVPPPLTLLKSQRIHSTTPSSTLNPDVEEASLMEIHTVSPSGLTPKNTDVGPTTTTTAMGMTSGEVVKAAASKTATGITPLIAKATPPSTQTIPTATKAAATTATNTAAIATTPTATATNPTATATGPTAMAKDTTAQPMDMITGSETASKATVATTSDVTTATTSTSHNRQDSNSSTNSISGLNPHSSIFTPVSDLDTLLGDLQISGNFNPFGTPPGVIGEGAPSTERDPLRNRELARLSLQSASSSTYISTPNSQVVFNPPMTPSSGLTWGSSLTATPPGPYTPRHLSQPELFSPFRRAASSDALTMYSDHAAKREPEQGRFLLITNMPHALSAEQISGVLSTIAPNRAIIVNPRDHGCVFVIFYDSRNAAKVYETLAVSPVRFNSKDVVDLHCVYVTPDAIRQATGAGNEWDHLWINSESTVKIQVNGGRGVSRPAMENILSNVGDLKSFRAYNSNGKAFTADFYDTRSAINAIRMLNKQTVEDGTLQVTYASEDPFLSVPSMNLRPSAHSSYTLGSSALNSAADSPQSSRFGTPVSRRLERSTDNPLPTQKLRQTSSRHFEPFPFSNSFDSHNSVSTVGTRVDSSWQVVSGPGGTVTPPRVGMTGRRMSEPGLQGMLNNMDSNYRPRQRQGMGTPWGTTADRQDRQDRQAIPPENRVYPEKIIAGLDSRTSIMVKDVPNKLSRQELINILNDVVPGEYDFVYLRFDFNNHCNVGYAFVNFTSIKALFAFIKAKAGRKWNMFSSEKVLQVSYANIQGKAALVNKFRNSAVMEVTEEWRPMIFYSSGALKGQQEPFPEADNAGGRRGISNRPYYPSGLTPGESSQSSSRYEYDFPGPFGL